MKRAALFTPHRFPCFLLMFFAISHTALARENAAQQLGMRLFNQSCRVCHTKPTLLSPQYGPTLSMDTLGGKADIIRGVISNGTPRMPGFKYDFNPAQIDAIVAYIKSIPAPVPNGSARPSGGAAPGAD